MADSSFFAAGATPDHNNDINAFINDLRNIESSINASKDSAASSATSASSSASTATTKADEAANSATSASNSATTATNKAAEASSSATDAATSKTNAATSETNAAASAINASNSATLSQDWATKTDAEVVAGQGFGAKKYAQDASASAAKLPTIAAGDANKTLRVNATESGFEVIDAATQRTNLGLGTIATQAASAVAITGGSVAGITDLAIADGGTGASTAAAARTNLGSTAVGDAVFTAVDAPAARSTLGLGTAATRVIGTANDQVPLSADVHGWLGGFKNRIINGSMKVDQRNNGASVTVVNGTYIVDQIQSSNTTGTGSITGQQSTLGNRKSVKLTASTAVTDLTTNKFVHGLLTILEAQFVYDLNGKSVSVSFTVETNWTGSLPVAVRNKGVTRSYVTEVPVTAGINKVHVVIPFEADTVTANDNGQGFSVCIGFTNEGDFRTATKDAWIAGNFVCSTSTTQWVKTAGNFINVTDLELVEGSVPLRLPPLPKDIEEMRCKRFTKRVTLALPLPRANQGATDRNSGSYQHDPEMRAAPSVSLASGGWVYEGHHDVAPTITNTKWGSRFEYFGTEFRVNGGVLHADVLFSSEL